MEHYFATQVEWRRWLEENHSNSDGIWLIYYKKQSGKPRIPYNDAVDEALCFGWIDGKIMRVNDDYYKQWFTPRRKGSKWSKLNIQKAQRLISEGLMMEPGLKAYKEAVKFPDRIYDSQPKKKLIIPADLLEELKMNGKAWDNFISFPESAQQLYLRWLDSAKRSETRLRRINKIVDQSANNLRPGIM
jgi:uncharacterized protein YdeI (YjbR/CyaY-like superfamily)